LAMAFLGQGDQAALVEAATSIEARSSAEIVIVVRPQSGSYRDAELMAGILAGLVLLWFLLFSPWEFDWGTMLWAPTALGVIVALVVDRAPALVRGLTGAERRRRAVHAAACAEFVDREIDLTRGRTGVLVYVSVIERAAEVLPDRGILAKVPRPDWDARVGALAASVAAGKPGRDVAAHVRALGDLLATSLPRAADDVDELADEVVA
jgi:putative membrane protein